MNRAIPDTDFDEGPKSRSETWSAFLEIIFCEMKTSRITLFEIWITQQRDKITASFIYDDGVE